MLIVMILLILVIAGFLIDAYTNDYDDVGITMSVMSMILLFLSIIVILVIQFRTEIDYQILSMKREMLIEQYERINNYDGHEYIINGDIGNLEDVYEDIIDFNRTIISNRIFYDNLFVNWFYNQQIHNIELIPIGG